MSDREQQRRASTGYRRPRVPPSDAEPAAIEPTGIEPTGIEKAAVVFSGAAYLNVGLSFVLLRTDWLGEIGAHRFLFLGLELAAAAVVTATLALAVGPHRGRAARSAWLAAGAALALSLGGVLWLLPRLFAPQPV